jgi:selenocysteine lyase/cysteine desulfurase
LPVEEWVEFLARNQVRVSPERGGVRISFGMFNTVADVERVVAIIAGRLGESGRGGNPGRRENARKGAGG